jgi:hypothetical protein
MNPLPRRLEPEWLDSLDHRDPRAVRARRDLRLINALMGNEGWILREVSRLPGAAEKGIVEIGSGDGHLLARLSRLGPATGCDLAPKPPGLPEAIAWRQGDLFSLPAPLNGGILVANLFLHHFNPASLRQIGGIAAGFDALVLVEPHRSRGGLALARLLLPIMSEVTRHDMPVSIHAGFARGELTHDLGLSYGWSVSESSHWRGSLRLVARRLA